MEHLQIPKRPRGRPPLPEDRRRERVYVTLSPQARDVLVHLEGLAGIPQGHCLDVAVGMLSALLHTETGRDLFERQSHDSIALAKYVAEKISAGETFVVEVVGKPSPALAALRQAIDQ